MKRVRATASQLTDRPKLNCFMDFHHYVGIDIAKATLDWAVYSEEGNQMYFQTPNSVAGVKIGLRNLKALTNWQPTKAVFCMEYTGIVRHEVARFEYG